MPPIADEHVTVLRQEDRRTRAGIKTHVAGREARVVTHRGIRLSPPLQVFVDLASMLSLLDLVVVGDALLKMFKLTTEQLAVWCAASTNPHAPAARKAASYVREEVDSPMESRLRMLIVLEGLPEPQVNHKIRWGTGRAMVRLDLSYPHLKLVIEYDGRQHAQDTIQWNHDLERRECLDDEHWQISS